VADRDLLRRAGRVDVERGRFAVRRHVESEPARLVAAEDQLHAPRRVVEHVAVPSPGGQFLWLGQRQPVGVVFGRMVLDVLPAVGADHAVDEVVPGVAVPGPKRGHVVDIDHEAERVRGHKVARLPGKDPLGGIQGHVGQRHAGQQSVARHGDRHPLAAEGPEQVLEPHEPVEVRQSLGRQAVQHEPAAGLVVRLHLGGIGGQRLEVVRRGRDDGDPARRHGRQRIGGRGVLQVDRIQHLAQRRLDSRSRLEELQLIRGAVVQRIEQQRLGGRVVRELLAHGQLAERDQAVVDRNGQQRRVQQRFVALHQRPGAALRFEIRVLVDHLARLPREEVLVLQALQQRVRQVLGERRAADVRLEFDFGRPQPLVAQRVVLLQQQHSAAARRVRRERGGRRVARGKGVLTDQPHLAGNVRRSQPLQRREGDAVRLQKLAGGALRVMDEQIACLQPSHRWRLRAARADGQHGDLLDRPEHLRARCGQGQRPLSFEPPVRVGDRQFHVVLLVLAGRNPMRRGAGGDFAAVQHQSPGERQRLGETRVVEDPHRTFGRLT